MENIFHLSWQSKEAKWEDNQSIPNITSKSIIGITIKLAFICSLRISMSHPFITCEAITQSPIGVETYNFSLKGSGHILQGRKGLDNIKKEISSVHKDVVSFKTQDSEGDPW